MPQLDPVHELPSAERFIEFDYCKRIREGHKNIAVHFFEDDYKFEKAWTGPDRYGEMLSKFAYILGPDFSQFVDFPKAVCVYNHYRNLWLAKYWQLYYNITVVPTIMWGFEDTWDWCFDGYPKGGIVAVSNVGSCQDRKLHKKFHDGYAEMLKRLTPTKILMFSRNFEPMPGNVQYIRWELFKGEQVDG